MTNENKTENRISEKTLTETAEALLNAYALAFEELAK